MNLRKDITGMRVGRLLVLKQDGFDTSGKNTKWLCQCDCGNLTSVNRPGIIQKKTLSCGCYNRQRVKEYFITHGLTESETYFRWTDMKTRCLNKNSSAYKNYGGRGIKICERWINSFENFLDDMGEALPGMTIERINNELGYFKENCKWIPKTEQPKNRRSNIYIDFNGEKICAKEFCRRMGNKISYNSALINIKKLNKMKGLINV